VHGICECRFAEIRCADAEVSLTQIGTEEESEFFDFGKRRR